jgi:hypothetical protein
MNTLIRFLTSTVVSKGDVDYLLVRASMVIIYFFFGYQKWFDYEAQGLIPFFTHGPLISWMYPVFGIKGSSYFLGVSEGCLGRYCSRASGIRSSEYSELSGQFLPSSRPLRPSPLCRMAGPRPQADSARWWEKLLSS